MRTYTIEEAAIINAFYPIEGSLYVSAGEIITWNVLMPLVENINSPEVCGTINIDSDTTFLHFPNEKPDKLEALRQFRNEDYNDSKIDATYQAVIEFIFWYMKNKS